MNRLIILASLAVALILAAPADAAPKDKPGKPDKAEVRDHVKRGSDKREEARERAELEREMAEERAEEAEEAAEREREMAEERAEEAEERAEREREMAEERREEAEEMAEREREMAEERRLEGEANRGSERAAEMRARRDERKEIMDEYRAGEPGEATEVAVDENEAATKTDDKKGKKPWWKFWGD